MLFSGHENTVFRKRTTIESGTASTVTEDPTYLSEPQILESLDMLERLNSSLPRTGHKNPLREEEMTRRRNDIKEEKEGKEDR